MQNKEKVHRFLHLGKPPARAASVQPSLQWVLQRTRAATASYSPYWRWWLSVPSFLSEQVLSPQRLTCCSYRTSVLWHQKINWISVTQFILPCQAIRVLQGPVGFGRPLTCKQPLFKCSMSSHLFHEVFSVLSKPQQLTTTENTITYHNTLCWSLQNFAQALSSVSFGS